MNLSVRPDVIKEYFVELYGSGMPPPLLASSFIDLFSFSLSSI